MTWSVLLVEAASNVQASVIAAATQVKANFVGAVLTLEAAPLDGIQPTRVTTNPASTSSVSLLTVLDTTMCGLCMHQNAYAQNQLMHRNRQRKSVRRSCKLAMLCLYTLESTCAVCQQQWMLMRFPVAYP